jgi:hypothetical protein
MKGSWDLEKQDYSHNAHELAIYTRAYKLASQCYEPRAMTITDIQKKAKKIQIEPMLLLRVRQIQVVLLLK